uniref:Galactolipase n=1 Tax=Parachlorella kessleri TaxID=3074 RepID=A0A2Z5TTR4_PARKE|nr:galactolipase [Parachlorella kessleri]BBC20823.1 galactolipase [Parachlorella kessleri]
MAHPKALLQLQTGALLQAHVRVGGAMRRASLATSKLALQRSRRIGTAVEARRLSAAPVLATALREVATKSEVSEARQLELRGSNDWKGLLPTKENDTIDPDLRATILMYGEMAEVTYDSFIGDPSSRFFGRNRFEKPSDLYPDIVLPQSKARSYELLPNVDEAYMFATEGAYKLSDDSKEGNPSPDRIADPQNKNWIGYIAVSKEAEDGMRDIAIMFRGTITGGEWKTNIFGDRLVAWDPRTPGLGGKVHEGFRATYWETGDQDLDSPRATVRRALEAILRKHGTSIGSVTVTGHSLGGALASVAAYDVGLRLKSTEPGSIRDKLTNEGVKIRDKIHVSAITFASPRVGNPDFKHAVKQAGVKMLRVVNYRDVVPQVPGFLSTAVTKSLILAGIDARAPGDGVGTVLKFLNWGLSKVPVLGDWSYEHTDPEWTVNTDDITYVEGPANNAKRPMRVLERKDVGPRHNLEVYLYMVATLSAQKGGAIERDPVLLNKGDWCVESKWLEEHKRPDTPKAWFQPQVCETFSQWKKDTYGK